MNNATTETYAIETANPPTLNSAKAKLQQRVYRRLNGSHNLDDTDPPSMEFVSSDESRSSIEESPSPKKSTLKKNVSFGHLEELQFDVEKGCPDHFEMAYPLQLGNNLIEYVSHSSVDDYEAKREYPPRPMNELKVESEERKQIIKACKKLQKEIQKRNGHRRRNSIGNGQISHLGDYFKEEVQPVPQSNSEQFAPPSPSPRRPKLRRQNSIGNGQISRDKRRNRVQDFLKFIKPAAPVLKSKVESKLETIVPLKELQEEIQKHNGHQRRNSIGNGQISRLGEVIPPPPPEQPKSEPIPTRRPKLRRQNSIGNGQISRDKRRNRMQDFLKFIKPDAPATVATSKFDEEEYERQLKAFTPCDKPLRKPDEWYTYNMRFVNLHLQPTKAVEPAPEPVLKKEEEELVQPVPKEEEDATPPVINPANEVEC